MGLPVVCEVPKGPVLQDVHLEEDVRMEGDGPLLCLPVLLSSAWWCMGLCPLKVLGRPGWVRRAAEAGPLHTWGNTALVLEYDLPCV